MPVIITSDGGGDTASVSILENVTAVTTVTALPSAPGQTLIFAIIGGKDAALFTIDPATGALTLIAAPDFESLPATGATPGYQVVVLAIDGLGAVDTQTLTVTVDNVAGIIVTADAAVINGTSEEDTLTGGVSNNQLNGLGGNDLLDGGAGNDTMTGGTGNDTYVVGAGGDRVVEAFGGGIDKVETDLASHTMAANVEILVYTGAGTFAGIGNALDNAITGGIGADRLTGGLGSDSLYGGDGYDVLYIDADDAIVDGGAGTDTVYVQGSVGVVLTDLVASGIERVNGGAGGDELNGDGAITEIRLNGKDGNDTLGGGSAADLLDGGAGDDTLVGGGGADRLTGGAGIDSLEGGDGDDTLTIDADDDVVQGGAGTDLVIVVQGSAGVVLTDLAASGIERVNGGAGGDLLNGDSAITEIRLNGNGGNDTLVGGSAADLFNGGAGDDSLAGGGGMDRLTGGDGIDILEGGDGDDTLTIDAADVSISGGGGYDTVIVTGVGGITLNMVSSSVERFNGGAGADEVLALTGVTAMALNGNAGDDRLFGGDVADVITGGANNDQLFGMDGDDRLIGGDGGDLLVGGTGKDIVTGGLGADIFGFSGIQALGTYGPIGVDTIADFNAADDSIGLDANDFASAVFIDDVLDASDFFVGSPTAATKAGEHIVYNQATGQLYYDANGADAGGAVLFATLVAKPILTSADITLVDFGALLG